MENKDLKERTKEFSVKILKFIELISVSTSSKVIIFQLVKSATSVSANYRAACRARSDKEFVSKMNIVLEESDETLFWLELIAEMKWVNQEKIEPLVKESNELTAIFVTILKKVNSRINNK